VPSRNPNPKAQTHNRREQNETTGRKNVKGPAGSPNSLFSRLAQTPEGRAQLAAWRALAKNTGRPPGARDGTTKRVREKDAAKAKAEAQRLVKLMEEKFDIPKEGFAREALETAVTEMRKKELASKDRLAAARLVLEWTKAKPAAESNVTIKKAEDFLADLAKDAENE